MTETSQPVATRGGAPTWAILLIAVAAIVLATAALTATLVGRSPSGWPSMMNGSGNGYGGMMGDRSGTGQRYGLPNGPQPGESGFVAGTASSPRVIRLIAGPGYRFAPSSITVQRGETVTFLVTTMGPAVHEFMMGPADAVAADREGTPEIADIGMMQTGSLTFTFDGAGPYAFACHADGHYEAGMRGTVTVVG